MKGRVQVATLHLRSVPDGRGRSAAFDFHRLPAGKDFEGAVVLEVVDSYGEAVTFFFDDETLARLRYILLDDPRVC